MRLIEDMKEQIKGKDLKLVFPEGNDIRVLGAAIRLKEDELIEPILVGDRAEIQKLAEDNNKTAEDLTILNPNDYDEMDELVEVFLEKRKGKIDEEGARKLLLEDPNYFGILLLETSRVDGFVSGAVGTTGDTVRPALQIIKTSPGVKVVSGVMFVLKNGQEYLFSDIALNIEPSAEELAEIAITTAETARSFEIEPKVAMLSFSTKGSAKSDGVDKVVEATKLVQERRPDIDVDGELQFDAAVSPVVAKAKAPDSTVAGHANVFIFPEISGANIGYKIAQRLGGFIAIGPVLQGINKPVNDLSRGCDEDDAYNLALITAVQALN